VHAGWLNQVQVYFSVLQRKLLPPNDFADAHELEDRILAFQAHSETIAEPFQGKFTRADLHRLLAKLAAEDRTYAA